MQSIMPAGPLFHPNGFVKITNNSLKQNLGPMYRQHSAMTKQVNGGAGGIRTPDLRFRKPTLYPSELQPLRSLVYYGSFSIRILLTPQIRAVSVAFCETLWHK